MVKDIECFAVKHGVYHCEGVPLTHLAKAVGTPAYIYSQSALEANCAGLIRAFAGYPTLPCFAVKAMSNLTLLRHIFGAGFGADLVSGGELQRSLLAGARPDQIVFSGVGKQSEEIDQALAAGILMFNVESPYELDLIATLAGQRGLRAAISLRVNPNIDAKTNAKIATGLYSTKFGLPEAALPPLLDRIGRDPRLELVGIGCHIGSQIVDIQPLRDAARQMVQLAGHLHQQGHKLRYLDLGGGLGIRYDQEVPPSFSDYADALIKEVRPSGLHLIIEPGRALVGNTAILLTKVLGVKTTPERHFVIVDAAMNDLIRPTLYGSYHEICPVVASERGEEVLCDFVGPICETGDFLAKERRMQLPAGGDLMFLRSCGAYGASMASQYNSRPRAPEVLVSGTSHQIVRRRETPAALWADELV
ncbi:MAG: diaminopimelate decarboxylase [Proteobacteria bacterium]|nr:diaminopimelate decarboxylase [Pseudomonadota bacterium]